jgi:hypothetical protein
MLWRFVIAALAAVVLLGSNISMGTKVHAQAPQAAPSSPNIGQSVSSPQVTMNGGVQNSTGPSAQGQTIPPQRPAQGGSPPPRLPGQNCRGLGACAWGNQSDQTAACTADARVCTSTSGGPDWPTMRCSANGASRTCSNDNGGLIIPNTLPSTTSTGVAPNGQLGTGTTGTSTTSTLPGPCINC